VGSAYLAHARRIINKRTHDDDERELEEQRKLKAAELDVDEEDDLGVGDEDESPELLARDAREWKVYTLPIALY
jgi:DnaJ family protein C protein 2